MKTIINFIFVATSFITFSQLNCKTSKGPELQEIKTCFHKNGKVSTIEEWQKDNRFGTMKGYNAKGELIFTFHLRKIGGHASAHVGYYGNGQASKVEYSSAPDAGIQWYRETLKFNEEGLLLDKWVDEHPYKTYIQEPYFHDTLVLKKEKLKEVKQEVVACATPYTTEFKIKNTTNKTIRVILKPKPNLWISLHEKIISIEPGEFKIVDSIILAEKFLQKQDSYELDIDLPYKKKSKYEFLNLESENQGIKTIHQWVLVKK